MTVFCPPPLDLAPLHHRPRPGYKAGAKAASHCPTATATGWKQSVLLASRPGSRARTFVLDVRFPAFGNEDDRRVLCIGNSIGPYMKSLLSLVLMVLYRSYHVCSQCQSDSYRLFEHPEIMVELQSLLPCLPGHSLPHLFLSSRFVSYRIALYRIALHCIASYRFIVVSYRAVSYRVLCRVVSSRTVSYLIVL